MQADLKSECPESDEPCPWPHLCPLDEVCWRRETRVAYEERLERRRGQDRPVKDS